METCITALQANKCDKIWHTKLTTARQDPAIGGDVHMVTLRLCLFASLLFSLTALLKVWEKNIGTRRRGRKKEKIYLGINRFDSTMQHLSAAFSTSLLPQWGEHKTSDWKVSSCPYSILGKNLKEKNKWGGEGGVRERRRMRSYGCKMKCALCLCVSSAKAELAKQRCSRLPQLSHPKISGLFSFFLSLCPFLSAVML